MKKTKGQISKKKKKTASPSKIRNKVFKTIYEDTLNFEKK